MAAGNRCGIVGRSIGRSRPEVTANPCTKDVADVVAVIAFVEEMIGIVERHKTRRIRSGISELERIVETDVLVVR